MEHIVANLVDILQQIYFNLKFKEMLGWNNAGNYASHMKVALSGAREIFL